MNTFAKVSSLCQAACCAAVRFFLCAALFLFLPMGAFAEGGGSAPGEKSSLSQGDEVVTRLPNGLEVYVIRDRRFPLVCTRLYVNTGSANEDAKQAGISHVLEHMVFKGTKKRPKGQVAKEVESLGGYLNAATSFDKTWYLTDMPSAHWRTGMDVVHDMAFNAALDPAELEAEKNVIVSELQGGEDDPAHKLFEELQTAGLRHSPYGRPIIGFEDTIRAVTSDALRAYVARWYQPQNMQLLVAGDIDPEEVLAYARELFGGLANTEDLSTPSEADLLGAPDEKIVDVRRGPWKTVYLGISFPAPPLRDMRSVDLDILSTLLAGDNTARFVRRYRIDSQLVNSIAMNNMSLARAGLLTCTVQLDADKVDAFWDAFTKDWASLKGGDFAPELIKRAVFNVRDEMDRAGETLNGLVGWKSTVRFVLGGPLGEANYRGRLDAVSQDALQAAIDAWLVPERCRVRVLAPTEAQLPDFEAVLKKNWPASAGAAKVQAGYMTGEREIVDLGNGRTLVLLPDTHAPYFSLEFRLTGGNALLDPEQQGLASLAAKTLTDGCGDLDQQAFERFLLSRASSLNASAGRQTFSVGMTGPSRFMPDLLPLLAQVVKQPRFEEKFVRLEADDMKNALRKRADRPQRYLFSKIDPFLYGRHAYGYDTLGTETILDGLKPGDVRAFWLRQTAQPWVMSVAGSFDKNAVLAFARSLPAPTAPVVEVKAPSVTDKKELDLHLSDRSQAHLIRIFPTVAVTHPDVPALMLLDSMLSGQSGLLFSSLRDNEGLGYTVTSFLRTMREAGFMALYIGTTPDRMEQSKQGFDRVVAALRKDLLPERMLKDGANQLWGEYVRGKQSLGDRAAEAVGNMLLGDPDFNRKLLEKVAHVRPEDIREVARKYLKPEETRTLTVGP